MLVEVMEEEKMLAEGVVFLVVELGRSLPNMSMVDKQRRTWET